MWFDQSMKCSKKAFCLFFPLLGLIAVFQYGCGVFSNPPEHAGHIPADAWLVASGLPATLMENAGYEELMKKFLGSTAYGEMSEKEQALFKLFKFDDLEKTGIALSEPAYFYVSGNPDEGGSIGFTFLLDDGEAFAELMNGIVNHDKKDGTASLNVSSEDGISKISEKGDRVVFLYNEEKFLFTYGNSNPKKLFKEPNDFEVLPLSIQNHLQRSSQLGVAVDYDNMLVMGAELSSKEAAVFASMLNLFDGGGAALELDSDDGSIEVSGFVSYGESSEMGQMFGDSVDSDLLEVIPEQAIAAISMSLNLKGFVETTLEEIGKDLPSDGFPKNGSFVIPGMNFNIDDFVEAIPGDFAVGLTGVNPSNRDNPFEFVAALKTADADSKEYKRVISDGILEEVEGVLKLIGVFIEEKENLLLVGTAKNKSILREAEAKDPISGDKEDILSVGYLGFWLDANQLIDSLAIDQSELRDEEKLMLSGAKKLGLLSATNEKANGGEISTVRLTFQDDDRNGFGQIVDFLAEVIEQESIDRKRRREEWEKEYGEDASN